jgi:hypothetical protein
MIEPTLPSQHPDARDFYCAECQHRGRFVPNTETEDCPGCGGIGTLKMVKISETDETCSYCGVSIFSGLTVYPHHRGGFLHAECWWERSQSPTFRAEFYGAPIAYIPTREEI